MNIQEVIDHYGSVTAMAKAMKVTRPVVYRWKEVGIPIWVQAYIELETEGKFKLDRRRMRH